MIGPDLTPQAVMMRLLAGLLIAMVQGAAIAGTAVLLGDKGPRHDGRFALLSWSHVDLLGLGSLMLTGFGWGRPVAVDPHELRPGRWGLLAVVLAGSISLLLTSFLLLQLVAPLLRGLDFTAGVTAVAFVREAARLCVVMALLSLLPIPPLAGAHFLAALGVPVPRQAGSYLGWVIVIASVLGVTRLVLKPGFDVIAPLVLGPDSFL